MIAGKKKGLKTGCHGAVPYEIKKSLSGRSKSGYGTRLDICKISFLLSHYNAKMDEICQDDQWFEQAFTYMSQHDIPLANDKKLHVRCARND
jgi:hypothetical protein